MHSEHWTGGKYVYMDNIYNLCSWFWRHRGTHNSANPRISTSAGQRGAKEMQIRHFESSCLKNLLKDIKIVFLFFPTNKGMQSFPNIQYKTQVANEVFKVL